MDMSERGLSAQSRGLDLSGASCCASGVYDTFEFSGVHEGLRRLRLWIAANGALRLTLRHAAAVAGLEPHYLSRVFRCRVGQTFLQWTRAHRTLWAIRAIETGAYSLDEVAKSVGYRSRRSLERMVRDATGSSPAILQRKGAYLVIETGNYPCEPD